MAININNYVDVHSGLGAGAVLTTRSLVGRLFTANPLVPPGDFITFSTAQAVGEFFGTTSEEYYRALFYFSFISKSSESPQSIQYARWVNAAVAPMVFGSDNSNPLLSLWQSITSGSFGLTIAGVANIFSSIDFSSAVSLAGVASIVQSTINDLYAIYQTGTLASSTTVTALDDTSVLTVGMSVQGANIPAGTTIATIVSGTSITLSHAATATTTETLTFFLPADANWVNATVAYDPVGGSFNFVGGATGAATISVQAGAGGNTDITGTGLLQWIPQAVNTNGNLLPFSGAIWAAGADVETLTACLTNSASNNNNFGSFLFMNNLNLNISQVIEIATWNFAQNVMFMYTIPVSSSNATTWASSVTGVGAIGGCALTLSYLNITQTGNIASSSAVVTDLTDTSVLQVGMPVNGSNIPAGTTIALINSSTSITLSANATSTATEVLTFTLNQYPEQMPMMILAATNYSATNSVQNYMYQSVVGLTPSVTTDAQAAAYDALSINYYGQTQTSGAQIAFYQRGLLQGSSVATNITDMTPYANEIWLKDANVVAIMNLLLSVNQVAANNQGRSQILTVIQQAINQALVNGTISVGKMLTNAQKAFITNETGDENAWYQVQNDGYWVDCIVQPIPNVSPTQYQANYTLIYSKDDVIRKVVGTQTLI